MPTEITTAVIGGTGLTQLEGLTLVEDRTVETPYGPPSSPLHLGLYAGRPVVFLARHGQDHRYPPHLVNYRANIWALHQLGIRQVIAVAAVGGIHAELGPAALAVPDQIIDYTWGRAHTFSEEGRVLHADCTEPYDGALRDALIAAAARAQVAIMPNGIYAVMQGPRLETAAEICKLRAEGCTMVGMTAMPEAALARELGLAYATLAVSVNWAAGLGPAGSDIHGDIAASLSAGMDKVRAVLREVL